MLKIMFGDVRFNRRSHRYAYIVAVLAWGVMLIMSFSAYTSYNQIVSELRQNIMMEVTKQLKNWGDYHVIMNFTFDSLKVRTSDMSHKEADKLDVTLVTQCSVNNLHHIVETLQRWEGSLSVAVFAPGSDFVHAIIALWTIQRCFPSRDVRFHLVFPSKHPLLFTESALRVWYNSDTFTYSTLRCGRLLDALLALKGLNYARGEIDYPHNTLRNVAKSDVITRYMFLLDVDVMPSLGIRQAFLNYITSVKDEDSPDHVVYVTPVFEAKEDQRLPRSKAELIRAYKSGSIRIFHVETCPWCHKATKYTDWLSIPETDEVFVAYEAEWAPSWEPFYIASTSVPDHDERFRQYGYDRISQVCELHVAGCSFMILANQFVIHRGLKQANKFHSAKNEENKRNWMIYSNEFQETLKIKYSNSTRTCKETNKREGRAKVKFHPHLERNTRTVPVEAKKHRDL